MNKILSGLAMTAALAFSSSSMALPALSVGFDYNNDNVFDNIVADNSAGDSLGLNNVIQATDFGNGLTINISTLSGSPFNMHMTAHMTTFNFNPAATATFGATATNLTLADLDSALFTAAGSGVFSNSQTTAYIDLGNQAFGMGDQIGGVTSATAFHHIANQYGITANSLFSLTLVSTLAHTVAGSSSIDADIHGQVLGSNNSVPEPSIIALLGLGLAGIGFAAARRRKQIS